MSFETSHFAIWSLDVEDNDARFYREGQFVDSCRQIHEIFAEHIGGTATWYLKEDFVSDITCHGGMNKLIEDVVASGGEIGVHVHQFSWEPYWRKRQYIRALRSLKDYLGITPTSYSAGCGNYINEDTRILMELGFTNGRLIYPGFPQGKADFEKKYYGLPCINTLKVHDLRAGYLDPDNCLTYTGQVTLVNFPEAYLHIPGEEYELSRQLKLGQPSDNDACKIVAYAKERSRFCHAWAHPHNLLDEKGKIIPKRRAAVIHLAELLKSEGYEFVTCTQAAAIFEKYGELPLRNTQETQRSILKEAG
jgi:hypothetical protein